MSTTRCATKAAFTVYNELGRTCKTVVHGLMTDHIILVPMVPDSLARYRTDWTFSPISKSWRDVNRHEMCMIHGDMARICKQCFAAAGSCP